MSLLAFSVSLPLGSTIAVSSVMLLPLSVELRAERIGRDRAGRARADQPQCAARGDAVDRAALAGHQRRRDGEVAAAIAVALPGHIGAARLIDRQVALLVGADAVASADRLTLAKPSADAVVDIVAARARIGAVAEHDAIGGDVQRAAAGARAIGDEFARRQRRSPPDEIAGADGGDIRRRRRRRRSPEC